MKPVAVQTVFRSFVITLYHRVTCPPVPRCLSTMPVTLPRQYHRLADPLLPQLCSSSGYSHFLARLTETS
jgi:hypothetical protein